MSKKHVKLNWSDRLTLIDHFTPTDTQVCSVFGVTQGELDTARTLRTSGTFAPNPTLDVGKYSSYFKTPGASAPTQTVHATPSALKATSKVTTTVHTKPETATKKAKVPQKRGRKGNRIELAFRSVTETPVPVETFMKQHNVSLAVLRQSKRFIEGFGPTIATQIGIIDVRQDKTTKQLMVSRRK
jgi:hypothetical protein